MVRFIIKINYIILSLMVGCGSSDFQTYFKYKLPLDIMYWFQGFTLEKNPDTVKVDRLQNCSMGLSDDNNNDKIPELEDVVKNFGYPIDKYVVTTEDEYVLTLLRVKHGKNGPDRDMTVRKPVFLQHGMLDSAAVYLAPRNGMAYYLADKGYDVWVGNSRGTKLLRHHLDKDKDPDKEGTTYWDFSFHEMGKYDLPAFLNKIRASVGDEKIHYIGMSMGSTQFLVLGSELPQYLDMIGCVVLMAPVARPCHMSLASGVAYYLSWAVFHTWRGVSKNGGEVGVKPQTAAFVHKFCKTQGFKKELCKKIMKNLQKPKIGENLYDFDSTLNVYPYSPASLSANCFIHYLQMVNEGKFQKFDYGKKINKVKYHQDKPPEYDLKKIKNKVYLLVGGNDDIAEENDVLWLHRKLSSSEVITENLKYFTHRDFHHSINIETNLYSTILKLFDEWESKEEVKSTKNKDSKL